MEQGSTTLGTAGVITPPPPSEHTPSLVVQADVAEQAVRDTAHDANTAVTDTASAVKNAVRDTVGHLKGAVKGAFASLQRTFDLPHHVRQYPWLMLGGAALLGFTVSKLLHRLRS